MFAHIKAFRENFSEPEENFLWANLHFILCLIRVQLAGHHTKLQAPLEMSDQKMKGPLKLDWPNCGTALVWVLGTGIFIGLTVRDFIPLYTDYTNNNVMAKIDIRHEPIRRPDVTVCLPWYSDVLSRIASLVLNESKSTEGCLECVGMARYGWDVWSKIPRSEFKEMDNTDVEELIVSAIMQKLLVESQSRDIDKYMTLNQSNYNWNQPIIDAIMHYFGAILQQDIFLTSSEKLLNLSITSTVIDQMLDAVLRALKTYVKFEGYFWNHRQLSSATLTNPLEGRKFVITGSHICFGLLPNYTWEWYQFTSFGDPVDPPWVRYQRKNAFYITPDTRGLYTPTLNDQYLYKTAQLQIKDLKHAWVTLTFSAIMRVSDGRPNRNCSTERESALCIAKRQTHLAAEYCKCVPFSYRYLYHGTVKLPYCNSNLYSSCQKLQESAKKSISEYCNNKCTHIMYTWSVDIESDTKDREPLHGPGFGVGFNTEDSNVPFVEFTLVVKDSIEKFIAQIGGIINLYLGFSGISICGFVVYCIKMYYRRRVEPVQERPMAIPMGHVGSHGEVLSVLSEKLELLVQQAEVTNMRLGRLEAAHRL